MGIGKTFVATGVLAAAVGIPLMRGDRSANTGAQGLAPGFDMANGAAAGGAVIVPPGTGQAAPFTGMALLDASWGAGLAPGPYGELVQMPVADFGEVFRFDVYPNWVKSRWARVSTCDELQGLAGMRVALATGPLPTDLCGSLTYYFDDRHRAQRILFRGWTGDASRLIDMLIRRFEFEPRRTTSAGLYVKKSWGVTTGVAFLEHPITVEQAAPERQVQVYVELTHPDGRLPVRPEAQEFLARQEQP
jgi:hypothetical protein